MSGGKTIQGTKKKIRAATTHQFLSSQLLSFLLDLPLATKVFIFHVFLINLYSDRGGSIASIFSRLTDCSRKVAEVRK